MVDDQQGTPQQPAATPPAAAIPPQGAYPAGYPAPAPGYAAPPPGYGVPQPVPGQPAWGPPGQPVPAQPAWSAVQPGYGAPGYQGQPPYGPPPGAPGYQGWAPAPPGYPAAYTYANIPYAGFWIRFFAYLIDGLILAAISIVCIVTIIGILALPFVALGYMPWMWWKKGGTLGQKALGLRVVRAIDGGPITGTTAVVRMLGMLLSGWVLYLGFIWVAFEPRKRGWHDMLADTVVIHV